MQVFVRSEFSPIVNIGGCGILVRVNRIFCTTLRRLSLIHISIRKLTTTLESQDIEFKKEGGVYHSTLTNNGALEIYVESWNGMPARQNEHIAVLDDTAPSIDEETVVMEDGKLELIAEDNISGINYEAVYATDDAGKRTAPVSYDKETGRITFDLEKGSLLSLIHI